MSYVTLHIRVILCDDPGCDEEYETGAGDTVRAVRQAAESDGWRRDRRSDRHAPQRDFCPTHAGASAQKRK